MNTEEIAASIQSELGPDWPRIKPIPLDVLAPLCEALWDEGKLPTRSFAAVPQCNPVEPESSAERARSEHVNDWATYAVLGRMLERLLVVAFAGLSVYLGYRLSCRFRITRTRRVRSSFLQ